MNILKFEIASKSSTSALRVSRVETWLAVYRSIEVLLEGTQQKFGKMITFLGFMNI